MTPGNKLTPRFSSARGIVQAKNESRVVVQMKDNGVTYVRKSKDVKRVPDELQNQTGSPDPDISDSSTTHSEQSTSSGQPNPRPQRERHLPSKFKDSIMH